MSQQTPLDSNSPAESTAAATESLGAWLAQTRSGFNAEQREVARHLGLNPTLIEAIENDDFNRLGPPVFVRGYLTRYARLLNLPEADVLERYRLQSSTSIEPPPLKVAPPFQRQTRLRDLRGVFYLLMLIGIAWTAVQNLDNLNPSRLLALWSDGGSKTTTAAAPTTANTQTQYPFQSEPTTSTTTSAPATTALATENPAPAKKAEMPLPTSTTIHSVPATPAATPSAPTPPTATPSVSGVVADVAPIAPTATITALPSGVVATTVTTSSATSESGTTPAPGEAKLLLEFSNECWVEVKDAQGNVLVNGLMKPNSTSAISGAAPFKVTLGNAPATRITLDDRLVNTEIYVPRRGTVSRFTLDRGQP